MRKLKKWLIDNFLPLWAKETVLSENKKLTAENFALKQKLKEQESYIRGMEQGQRAVRKIYITGEVKK